MKNGLKLPRIIFKTRVYDESLLSCDNPNPYRWQDMITDDYFADKRVVVFSLPGAFTPICSTYQVPGFEENYDKIKSLGIDEVYVISVNDAFVMNKWIKDQDVSNIKAIPDGSGEFTRRMGMLVDKANLGFGMRSWRYAAVVNNMVIEQWFEEPGIEDNCAEDPYGETSPETVINYLQEALED